MPHVFEGKPRGQSALEFLSTYAFVFLTISIVLLLLFAFSSIPKNILPTQCSFYSGFQCLDAALVVNASGVPELIVIASDSEPGVVNVSSFSAFLNYHSSKSGYCVPRVATAGEKIYCIANFTGSVTLGSVYTGTFKVIANYCANSPANITAFCPAGSAYTYGGNIRVQATKQVLGTSYYLDITITNSQGSAVPSHFQQEIQFSPSTYALEEAPDLGNIRFYFGSKELYSWCESGCSSTSSSNAIFWVKLPQAIPPGQSMVIQMYFLPKNVEYSGVHAGEAPQLSPSYGQYNNIGSVMNSGLLYQIWGWGGSGMQPQSELYQAIMNPSSSFTFGSTTATASNTSYTTLSPGTMQNVDGTNQGNVIINYQNWYSGGAPPPNPPVSNQNYWLVKAIGFISYTSGTTLYGIADDGIGLGYYNGAPCSFTSWLCGTSNPNNIINEWIAEGATTYSGTISSSGDYPIELDFENQGGPGYIGMWSSSALNYYSPSYPPNGIMPSVSFGTLTPA